MDVIVVTAMYSFPWRTLVQRNLVRTTQPARPVFQTEISSACVFPDLLALTVKTVLTHSISLSGLTQTYFDRGLKYLEWEVIAASVTIKVRFLLLLPVLLLMLLLLLLLLFSCCLKYCCYCLISSKRLTGSSCSIKEIAWNIKTIISGEII